MNKRVQQNLAVWKQVRRSERGLDTLFSRSLTLSQVCLSLSVCIAVKKLPLLQTKIKEKKRKDCLLRDLPLIIPLVSNTNSFFNSVVKLMGSRVPVQHCNLRSAGSFIATNSLHDLNTVDSRPSNLDSMSADADHTLNADDDSDAVVSQHRSHSLSVLSLLIDPYSYYYF